MTPPLYSPTHDKAIIAWRVQCFEAVGVDHEHAVYLAERRDIDRTVVERLAAKGCPSHLISATLL